jgi:diguanylate cyclase (GGDEF)-like protein
VLFLDLDGFKLVNDSLGESGGDQLLRAVAERLQQSADAATASPLATRLADPTVARIGSDEFLILLPGAGDLEAVRVANRLQDALAPSFSAGGGDVFVTATVGIAVANGQGQPRDVVRDAGTAMTRAKGSGKGRVELFDQTMRHQVIERLRLETSLHRALDAHEFVPFYQPIVSLESGHLSAFEALIRWRHPERGIVLPSEFVPAIEDNGLVTAIGRQLFSDVCRHLSGWRDEHPDAPHIAVGVNFAAQQIDDPALADRLVGVLDETGIDPSQIIVEVTESAAVSDLSRAVPVLTQIRDAGMRVVLDDFGTGYSSLAYLQSLPITGLKLDRSFIAGRHAHPEIVKAVVGLARHLKLTVTAEGVETEQQCEQLRALGCDYAQGYLFGKPMEASVAGDLARQKRLLALRP